MKGKLQNLWSRLKADITQDNMTKAKIAERTIQNALTGIQEAIKPDRYLPSVKTYNSGAVEETWTKPITDDFEMTQYREATKENGRVRHAGRLFILRKRG